jgi:flagellar hook-associated protein 2
MYSKLLSAITPGGTDGQTLREIGIGTSYNNGMTTLSLDEDKLRNALESDPDKVKNAFSKTKEGGSATDGLMQTMQNTLNTYVKTTGEPKGVLIQRAGSTKAYTSLNNNSLKSQMDSIDNQIDRWTDKMASQIDRYTTQFSRLEQLIAQMNSQASAMSGLMGGSTGY